MPIGPPPDASSHPTRLGGVCTLPWQTRLVRLLVARCSVSYEGRLGARLEPALRLIMCKADGSVAVHSDSRAYKPLNWMSPPCTIDVSESEIVARNPKGETLRIELHDVVHDHVIALGTDPGLEKDGVEAELQHLLAARVAALRADFTLVRREYPTDIGPVDLLCCDAEGRTVVVEVKRVGEIAGVEQLLRYQERLDRDPRFAPTVGMLVAQHIKPQAKVFAESKGVSWIEIDIDTLRGGAGHGLTLF
jgi:endonuclease